MRRLASLVLLVTACAEPSQTLPESWNTLRFRTVSIDVFGVLPAGLDIVKPLSGLEGSPLSGEGEAALDVTEAWWNRPNGSERPDGAHVDAVRVAPDPADTGCALTLGALFPSPANAGDDDLEAFADAVDAARAVNPQNVVWHASFGGGACDVSASASAEVWGAAIIRAVEYAPVEAVEVASDAVATAIRQARPSLPLMRGGFVLGSVGDAEDVASQIAELAPLDVLTFEVEAQDPEVVADVARTLALALDDAGLGDVQLGLTRFAPTTPLTLTNASLISAHVGAWEMAARVALQDVPNLAFAISGRGTPPGLYFDATGRPTPAFMARFPLRQIEGDGRVPTTDARDLRVLAALDGRVLKVLVVAWDVDAGIGALDYALSVPAFVPPVVGEVDLRVAELDAKNRATTSFFFSDLARLATNPANGDVIIERTIPVPGVHYLELERPEL